MKRLSKMTTKLLGQPMFKLLSTIEQMEKQDRKILHFEIGDSDFRAHDHIIEATKKALDDDKTHYVNSMGIKEFRSAVCEYTHKTLGFKPNINQVLIMPANGIVDCLIRCVADPGDEIICPDPGFSTYASVIHYMEMKKISVPLKEENQFHIDVKEIEKRITDKTRLVIITSPQNPTGAVLTKKEIEDIAQLMKERDLYLLSDEIYSRVVYGKEHYSPGFMDHCLERTIILNGFAKGFSMPGWRIGYAVGPAEVIHKMGLLFQTCYSCCSPFIQFGGIAALTGRQDVIDDRIKKYKELRDLMVAKLNEIPGIQCNVPDGAYYVFPNITGTGMSSLEFAKFVLEKAGVALLPGTNFGDYGEGYVRLCFTRSEDVIEAGCQAIKEALKKYPMKSQGNGTEDVRGRMWEADDHEIYIHQ